MGKILNPILQPGFEPGTSELDQLKAIVVPEIFTKYTVQKSVANSSFLRSGIVQNMAELNAAIQNGGQRVNVPTWYNKAHKAVSVKADDEGNPINSFSSYADIACVHVRDLPYGIRDLNTFLAGSDPLGRITDVYGQDWAVTEEQIILSSLKGIFGLADMKDSIVGGATSVLDSKLMNKAMFALGDKFTEIGAIAMHSQVLAKLRELNLIDTVMPSAVNAPLTYSGKEIIVDDTLVPESAGVYPIYFFGKGAFGFAENTGMSTVEMDRDILTHQTVVNSTRAFILHPLGVAYTAPASTTGETPSDADLENSANWTLVDDRKNVAITKLICKLDA